MTETPFQRAMHAEGVDPDFDHDERACAEQNGDCACGSNNGRRVATPHTLLELVDNAISGAWARAAGNIDPVDVRAEIVRRLELVNRYGGTEASHIKAILATGAPLAGWIADEPTHPQGTPEYDQYATELKTELGKFAAGEEPYSYEADYEADRKLGERAPQR